MKKITFHVNKKYKIEIGNVTYNAPVYDGEDILENGMDQSTKKVFGFKVSWKF